MAAEYRIVRFYRGNVPSEIVGDGLTLEEARKWCSGAESSSTTATSAESVARTAALGDWFEGYEEQER
jgi:hypothetical protein